MGSKQNYRGLDLFRLIAAILVIAIHTSPLTSFSADADFFMTKILARVAVPFFFMATGQFVVPGLLNTADTGRKLAGYLKKITLLYGIAILIYLPIGIYAGHYQELTPYGVIRLLVFDGTFYHLWYFPACIIGVTLLWLMSKFMGLSGMMAVSGLLYLLGLLGDSYFGLSQNVPVISTAYQHAFHAFSYTRNGLFFAPLFLLLGAWIGKGFRTDAVTEPCKGFRTDAVTEPCDGFRTGSVTELINRENELAKQTIPKKRNVLLSVGLAVSFLLMAVEAFTLHGLGWQRHNSMYLALIPTMVFLYQLLLLWQGDPHAILRTPHESSRAIPQAPRESLRAHSARLRTISTWVYILHPAVIVVVHAAAKVFHVSGLLVHQSLIHYIVVTSASLLAAFMLSLILNHPKERRLYSDRAFPPDRDLRFGRALPCGRAWVELDRNALADNVQFLHSRLPEKCRLMPAVKADAYGHGAVLISKELNRLGVGAFCVASIQEAIDLRRHGIHGEILILGYTHPAKFPLLRRYHLTQTVIDHDFARELNGYGKKIHVHIGIDTGMHRLGERSENIDRITSIFEMNNLIVDGMFTHLSASDKLTDQDKAFTESQVIAWNHIVSELSRRGYPCPKMHLLASYGILNYPELSNDYARVGIALYGVLSTKEDTAAQEHSLQPVLSLKARVATVRGLCANESAGYGMAFTADHDMRIATITIGYADGLPRSLSNGAGAVLINGCKAPIIGRICMDQTIVDVSNISNIRAGDIAVLIGTSGNQKISAADLAEQTHSITNEILSRLGSRLERIWAGSHM